MGTEGVNGIASIVYLPHGAPLALNRLGASLAFDYDGVQRPVVRGFLFPAPASNVTWVHSWNPASGLASDTRHGDDYAWTGAYNATRPYATNGLNQYATTGQPSTAGSVAFTYDANGNLATEATWNGTTYAVSTTYAYDIENRLVAVSGSRTAALRYDPLGRLYEVAAPSGTTRFLYDGDVLAAEYATSGTMLRRHAHWPGADIPMTTYEGSGFGTVLQLLADRQGSIAAIADHNGVRLSVNSYDEYGIPGAGNTGRFQYTGQIWLAELGMYHYKARIYSPTLGRFLQTDPVGYQDQYNLYAYVGNDPVNRTDPTGTTCVEIGKGGFKCLVDDVDRSRLTGTQLRQLNRFEMEYTRAVNRLKSLPDRRIPVRQSGFGLGAFTISRREAAANLIARRFVYDPDNPRTRSAATAFQEGRAGGKVATYVTDRGLAIGNAVTAVHDGALHGSNQEASGGLAGQLGQPPWRDGHQDPYRDASCQLLGGC